MSLLRRKTPVTHDDAHEAVLRFNASHFRHKPPSERARYSIPTDVERDDDCLLISYIEQNKERDADLTTLRQQLAAMARECEAWRAWNSRRPYTPPADINEQRAFERVMESLHVTNETIPDLAAVAKGGSNG